jgi:thiol-disulfide isomerase/thioredoxin
MARIQNILYNSYVYPYRKVLLILIIVILFLVIGVMIYQKYLPGALASNVKNNMANANIRSNNSASGSLDVYFFNVDWCPHCVKAKPAWLQFVQAYDGQTIHGYYVSCIGGKEGVNCTNADDPEIKKLVAKYEIQGFPTIKFVQNGTVVDFDARVSKENLDNFMNSLS